MKTKQKKSKLITIVAITVISIVVAVPSYAQTNIGMACGCPPLASRPTVSLSTLPNTVITTTVGPQGFEITTSYTLTCSNTYIIDKKIYIAPGNTLTIQPGTVIKGLAAANPSDATALIIERGAKILAEGTVACPIVFTAMADPMDGTYPIANIGQWGGLVILGKASNNLTLATNGPFVGGCVNGKLAVADGLGVIEGFTANIPQNRFGANISGAVVAGEPAGAVAFDDNDNSGILKYISVRFAGAVLCVGSEINAITLGSVGRGTTIDHIEVFSCADDGIEIFGGTVCLREIAMIFGNDDMLDIDLGYNGSAKFLFGLKTDNTSSVDSDNGFEIDSDDQRSNNLPRSHPIISNATMFGNNKTVLTGDNSSIAAINAKEAAGGEIYNSIFVNFKNGLNLIQATTAPRTANTESYHNWSTGAVYPFPQSLKVKCNAFVGITNTLTIDNGSVIPPAVASNQFITADGNKVYSQSFGTLLFGPDYNLVINNITNTVSHPVGVIPRVSLGLSCPTIPSGCFSNPSPVYAGAFNPAIGALNWLSNWSHAFQLGVIANIVPCPEDFNGDRIIDINDFLLFIPKFGLPCTCPEDIDGNGVVDITDFLLFLPKFGTACP